MNDQKQIPPRAPVAPDVPYCHHCGGDRLAYREQYANGREYQCRDCGALVGGHA